MTDTSPVHIPTIVYVEDNAGDALLLEEALREGKHRAQLLIIPSGDQALRYFQVKASAKDLPPPHCILLDENLPIVNGAKIFTFIRQSPIFNDTPVYIFAEEARFRELIQAAIVSKESFITKPNAWQGFLALATLLMRSASAKQNETAASVSDGKPEVHAEGELRRQETTAQRERASMSANDLPQTHTPR